MYKVDPRPIVARVLRPKETEHLTGLCDMTLRRMEAAGAFPKRFKLNPAGGRFGAVGHDEAEVEQWLETRRASRETSSSAPEENAAA